MRISSSTISPSAKRDGRSLAAALCHDLDNVLLSIDAHAIALRAAGVASASADARIHIDAIESAIAFLRQRSRRVRDASRRPCRQPASLRLDRWWLEVEPLAKASLPARVRLEAHFPSTLPPVRIESDELTACVLHLLVNAGQAIPPERTNGTVRIRGLASDEGAVRVQVADDGIGMSLATMRRAGTPGFTTRSDGTGMGLRDVREIVARSGGRLRFDARPGEGATFEMHIPEASCIEGVLE